jgi:CheY-like chemotaxis protein
MNAESTPRKLLILVVEDDQFIRKLIQDMLKDGPYDFIEAEDGTEALYKASKHIPDVIITDLMLPKLSGAEVIRELRRHIDFATTPIIAVTAGSEALKEEAKQAGAHLVLSKPLRLNDVINAVENLIASTPFLKK